MAESEVATLCRQIFQKHRQALDLIFEHRPDQQSAVRDLLLTLVDEADGLLLDSSAKSYIRFIPSAWDAEFLRRGVGWSPNGRMLLFEFTNVPTRLVLHLYIGPGPEEVRRDIFDMARAAGAPFKTSFKTLSKKLNTLYQREFLSATARAESTDDELEALIKKAWSTFISHDLPLLDAAVVEHLARTTQAQKLVAQPQVAP